MSIYEGDIQTHNLAILQMRIYKIRIGIYSTRHKRWLCVCNNYSQPGKSSSLLSMSYDRCVYSDDVPKLLTQLDEYLTKLQLIRWKKSFRQNHSPLQKSYSQHLQYLVLSVPRRIWGGGWRMVGMLQSTSPYTWPTLLFFFQN